MRWSGVMAAVAVNVSGSLACIGWALVPEESPRWAFILLFPPLLWAVLEAASTGTSEAAMAIRRVHRVTIAAMCLLLILRSASDLAVVSGLMGPEWRPVARGARGFFAGALAAAWGNQLPKIMSPWFLSTEPFDWQGVHRFVGRVFTVTGVALMVVWASLPAASANRAANLIWLSAIGLTVARKWLSVARYSAGGRSVAR